MKICIANYNRKMLIEKFWFPIIISGVLELLRLSLQGILQRQFSLNMCILYQVSGMEDGQRKVSTLRGIRRTSEVLLGGTLEKENFARRGRLTGIFNEAETVENTPPPPSGALTRSKSQPDFLQQLQNEDNKLHQEHSSIFVRPMGSIVIR